MIARDGLMQAPPPSRERGRPRIKLAQVGYANHRGNKLVGTGSFHALTLMDGLPLLIPPDHIFVDSVKTEKR